ncbi:ABC transporter permease [Ruminococcaceae bacterium OttesenSCG-928-L11]|nr:ABC transporter permease [Ruminococcaceae bacterium OttesenSCG-928-L11]
MSIIENILLAISGLRSAKMRSLLTMLGIIIGIGSVIAIVTIGNAMTAAVTGQFSSFGIRNIDVGLYSKTGSYGTPSESDLLSMESIERFAERFAGKVDAYTLQESVGMGTAKDGRKYANVRVMGVNDGFAIAQNFKLQQGRFLNLREVKGTKNMAVVSDRLVTNLFPPNQSPLGQEIKVTIMNEIHTFTIVGVYKYEASAYEMNMGSEKDIMTMMYIPVSTAKRIAGTEEGYDYITVTASETADPTQLGMEIEEYFAKEYGRNQRYGIITYSMQSMLTEITTVMDTLKLAISIIAGISLLVGGIGVMNIMLVSVTERTREIGTRKALGARNSAIRIQFIVEAMIICLIGGIIGIILGLAMGFGGFSLMRSAMALDGFNASPDVSVIVVAVLFSMGIGVFFGYYPANKAAKLDPIEALRYE